MFCKTVPIRNPSFSDVVRRLDKYLCVRVVKLLATPNGYRLLFYLIRGIV